MPAPKGHKAYPGSGRPSTYNEKKAEAIVAHMKDGLSMTAICKMPGMPSRAAVYGWITKNEKFAAECARAMEVQGDLDAERAREIIDDMLAGKIPSDVARVALSGLQWRASKLARARYGDHVKQEVTGAGGGPVQITITPGQAGVL